MVHIYNLTNGVLMRNKKAWLTICIFWLTIFTNYIFAQAVINLPAGGTITLGNTVVNCSSASLEQRYTCECYRTFDDTPRTPKKLKGKIDFYAPANAETIDLVKKGNGQCAQIYMPSNVYQYLMRAENCHKN